ncbi:hypothetical protein NXY31_20575 [Bacteroides salyersiae]|nr:hypothetical protein [Bacteroides salyersiae]MCS2406603.1 hypothetical protein [Bacteroides salyersiae]
MVNIDEYKELIQEFVYCLARKDYQAANNLILDNSVPISDLRRVIEEYGTTIMPIPEAAFEQALCYQISDGQVDIYIPLWSEEEGQSDLTLSLSCFQNGHKIQINDLEVL